jgi:hypothetical protein
MPLALDELSKSIANLRKTLNALEAAVAAIAAHAKTEKRPETAPESEEAP